MEAKHIKDIMEVYSSIYVENESSKEIISEEILDEKKIATGTGKKVMPSAKERSKLAKRARAGEDIGKKGKGFEKVAAKAAKQYGSKEAGERVAAAAMFKAQAHKEEFDNFDIVLEYLVSEGFAETEENALVIMANMSEEWRGEIIESRVSELGDRLKNLQKRSDATDRRAEKTKKVARKRFERLSDAEEKYRKGAEEFAKSTKD